MDDLLVRDIMSDSPVAIPPDASARAAAESMLAAKVGSLLVVDGKRPVGILTERDLVAKVLAPGADADSLRASDIMSTPLITIQSSTSVMEAAETMARVGVRRLPVSDRGRLVGLVTERDILAASPTLAEITHARGGESADSAWLSECDQCLSLTDGARRLDGAVVCDSCYLELRAR